MAPLVSDCLPAEKKFSDTLTSAYECSYVRKKNYVDRYYLITDFHCISNMSVSTNLITYSEIPSQSVLFGQMSIITMASKMFEGSKPMIGRDLIILKRTASRLISKTPTTLYKK